MWKIDVPPTSELLRLRVLVQSNGHSENREVLAHRLLRIVAKIRAEEKRRRDG